MVYPSAALGDSKLEEVIASLIKAGISLKNIKSSIRSLETSNPNDVQRYAFLLQKRIIKTKVTIKDRELGFLDRINRMSNYLSTGMSQIDSLTKLPNRRSLEDYLKRQLATAYRNGTAFSVLAYDLDGFKKVNDDLGHLAGDDVLRGIADIARETFRQSDFHARSGGDEFYAVANVGGIESGRVAEKFREAVENSKLGVTASIGVASVTEDDAVMLLYGEKGRKLVRGYFSAKRKKQSDSRIYKLIGKYIPSLKPKRGEREGERKPLTRDDVYGRLEEVAKLTQDYKVNGVNLMGSIDLATLSKTYQDIAIYMIMKKADTALYKAKESKNTVCGF